MAAVTLSTNSVLNLVITGTKILGANSDITITDNGNVITTLTSVPDGAYSYSGSIPLTGPMNIAVIATSNISFSNSTIVTIPGGSPDMLVVLTSNGNTYTFDSATGTGKGVYIDPQGRFAVNCISVANSSLSNFHVQFRSDTDGSRDEVVFEYGDVWANTTTPVDMGGYTVNIIKNGNTINTITTGPHNWMTRWRWQSAPRPITNTISQLYSANLLPVFDFVNLGNSVVTSPTFTYSPMGFAGLLQNMAITGERNDIGPVTEWQGDYMAGVANATTIMAQAEACGSFPIIFRDNSTGAPVDPIINPKISTYVQSGQIEIKMTLPRLNGAPIAYDIGHSPAMNYLPWLLTGDPFYLENLQFQCLADILVEPYQQRYNQGGRYLAWPLRNLFSCVASMPGSGLPSWLLPKSTMNAILTNFYNTLNTNAVIAPLDVCQSFGYYTPSIWPNDTAFAFWQNDMLSFSINFGVLLGFSNWLPIANTVTNCGVQRTNGTSGWLRGIPTLYDSFFAPGVTLTQAVSTTNTAINVNNTITLAVVSNFPSNTATLQVFPNTFPFMAAIETEIMNVTSFASNTQWNVTRTNPKTHNNGLIVWGPLANTWSNLWTLCQNEQSLANANNSVLVTPSGTNWPYYQYLRGQLSMGTQIGLSSNVANSANWMTGQCLAQSHSGTTWNMYRKWMIAL